VQEEQDATATFHRARIMRFTVIEKKAPVGPV